MTDEPAAWDADTALEQLYAAHWRSLVRLAVLVVGDLAQAEEITQDAFVAVHARWRRLRDPDKALAYLRQTVVNRSRSALRHRAVVDRHAQATGPTEASITALPGSEMRNLKLVIRPTLNRLLLTLKLDTRGRELSGGGGGGGAGGTEKS